MSSRASAAVPPRREPGHGGPPAWGRAIAFGNLVVQQARFTFPWRGEVDRALARSGGGDSGTANSVPAAFTPPGPPLAGGPPPPRGGGGRGDGGEDGVPLGGE